MPLRDVTKAKLGAVLPQCQLGKWTIVSYFTADQVARLTWSVRDYPASALVYCTLIARAPALTAATCRRIYRI
jgi:hypothetical protein